MFNLFKGKRKITTGLLLIAGALGAASQKSCEHYNKAAISPDGNQLAFSLNDEAGFEVDSSSEMYILNIENIPKPELKRITLDDKCDSFAEFTLDGDLMFIKESAKEGAAAYISTHNHKTIMPLTGALNGSCLCIQTVGEKGLAITTLAGDENQNDFFAIINYAIMSPERTGSGPASRPSTLEQLLAISVYAQAEGEGILNSTTPVFSKDGKMFYSTIESIKEEIKENSKVLVSFYSLGINTKIKTKLSRLVFPIKETEKGIAYVDLAVSPDNKILLASFIPTELIKPDEMDDSKNSQLYGIDIEEKAIEKISSDINLYYPQFAPIIPCSATQPSKKSKEPFYQFMFLSGKNHEKGGRSVYISDLNNNRKILASFPDRAMTAYTGWAWLNENKVRIFHVGNSGVILVDSDRQATKQEKWILTRNDLTRLKDHADFQALNNYEEMNIADKEMLRLAGKGIGQMILPYKEKVNKKLEYYKQTAEKVQFKRYENLTTLPLGYLSSQPATQPGSLD